MNNIFAKPALFVSVVLAMLISNAAFADDTGYWNQSAGKVWKNRFGECWRSGDWNPAVASEQCDPAQVTEPEPPAAKETAVLDSDGDGVPDFKDWCAGTPAGVQVDSRGCPLDSDGDGVANYQDRCANTPANTRVDEHGCPVVGTTLFTLEGVHFEFDSAKLRPSAESSLQQAVRKLRNNPGIQVGVIGYTDSVGPAAYNQELSMRRARAVADYLTANGISASRLKISGRGESNPIATNDTRAGRALNRRVELVVSE